MPNFSHLSKQRLEQCHPDLQILMNEVILQIDISILHGYRSPETQFEIFKKGRKLVDGKWIKTGKTFTQLDGFKKKSKHNSIPSLAVDVAPYPVNWKEIDRFKTTAIIIKQIYKTLKDAGKIESDIVWGGDWDSFKDYPHWEIK